VPELTINGVSQSSCVPPPGLVGWWAGGPLLSVLQQREELVAEVVALKEAMVLMRERENAITQWKQQLLEQADYLTSLMVRPCPGPGPHAPDPRPSPSLHASSWPCPALAVLGPHEAPPAAPALPCVRHQDPRPPALCPLCCVCRMRAMSRAQPGRHYRQPSQMSKHPSKLHALATPLS